jgi:hypothetical protein
MPNLIGSDLRSMVAGSVRRAGNDPPCVERPGTTANNEQKRQPEQRTVVGPGFVGRSPEATVQEHRNLGRCDSNEDVDEQRYRRQPRHEPEDEEEPATGFRVTGTWTESGITGGTPPALGGSPEVSETGVSVQLNSKENKAPSHPPELDVELGTVATFSGSLAGDVTGTQTATHVGRINGSLLGSLASATNGQALTFTGANWSPSSVVNSLTAGSGINVSSATGNPTVSVPNAGVSNSMLANPNVTVAAGTGLSGGGTVALGSTTTLNNTGVLSVGASAPLASSGGQSPTVSLSGMVPVANGGTGASDAATARSNLGAAASGANTDIVSLKGASDGSWNTAVGGSALAANTTGYYNTATGEAALYFNTTGTGNTATGTQALYLNTTGTANTAAGYQALDANTTGTGNTAAGYYALPGNTTGHSNTATGAQALYANTTGYNNTAEGFDALYSNTTGSNNIALGFGAGANLTTGNNTIDIGNLGVAAEANTIRIGNTQTATYIAGISGATSSSGVAVYVNSSGQLGTTTSSARFKEDIEDMGDRTNGILKLRPVRFRYKKDIDPSGLEQYGLVAEEVAKVYPDLVVYDQNGEPQTVRYHFVNAMLLNEVQKQARRIAAQEREINALREQVRQTAEQARQIEALTARLEQLETTVSRQGHAPAVEARLDPEQGY